MYLCFLFCVCVFVHLYLQKPTKGFGKRVCVKLDKAGTNDHQKVKLTQEAQFLEAWRGVFTVFDQYYT